MRGLFVTGTDTGVGKTVVAAAICVALRARSERVAAFKPVVTGLDTPSLPGWPHDHALLAAATGGDPERVAPYRFGPAASPHLAAELSGQRIHPPTLLAAARLAGEAGPLIVEGVGGLLVPLAADYAVADFIADLGLPLVVVAYPGLGTINHTLLTLQAARARALRVAAVVMTPWPAKPSAVERSNRETIERLGTCPVAGLAQIERADPALLVAAAACLPFDSWFAR
ncbi:MAG: dethiobiotin synthase [Solirubrobacteraceae bacterium]